MIKLSNFRVSYETAMLFVLSYEYGISFIKLLEMYNMSDKVFWAYLSLLSPMSKMGVRKAGQLSKTANRIYKNIYGIKAKKKRKVEVACVDEYGNQIMTVDGNPKVEKHIITEFIPIVLEPHEQKIKNILSYYLIKGYSNGETFHTDEDIMDKRLGIHLSKDSIKIDGATYTRTTKIEHILEKFFPDLTTADCRELSAKTVEELLIKAEAISEDVEAEVA